MRDDRVPDAVVQAAEAARQVFGTAAMTDWRAGCCMAAGQLRSSVTASDGPPKRAADTSVDRRRR